MLPKCSDFCMCTIQKNSKPLLKTLLSSNTVGHKPQMVPLTFSFTKFQRETLYFALALYSFIHQFVFLLVIVFS